MVAKGFADRRKAAVCDFAKEEIRAAASRVIAEHGFDGLTMSLVAREAGVAKGTLYSYFRDKTSLLLYVVLKSQVHLLDTIEALASQDGPTVEMLADIVKVILKTVVANKELIAMVGGGMHLIAPSTMPELREMQQRVIGTIRDVIERGMERGEIRQQDSESIATVFASVIGGTIQRHVTGEATRTVDEVVDELMSVIWLGIASDAKAARRK